MSQFIKERILDRIEETYNPNDNASEYTDDFIKNLLKARRFDPFNVEDSDGIAPAEFFAHLRDFVYSRDTELHIQYEDGKAIIIDVTVAKHMLANYSAQELETGAKDPYYMDYLIRNLGGDIEIVSLKACGCEGFDTSCECEKEGDE